MAGLAQPPAPVRSGLANLTLDAKTSQQRNKHKVVLESVTQEKKKLRTVLSFKAEPPKGYTFIPAGNPELTNALKEVARKDNHEIYAVSTTPHQRAHDLSQQVHRIGYHFPSVVVAQVCAHYGIVLSSAGTVLDEDKQLYLRRSERLKHPNACVERRDQITINTEARDTIKDLFPNIPDNDLNQIIKTSFQLGQGKVGTAIELTPIRRAQLAVVAHIRHIYTDYDKLLRQTHYRDARNVVEKPTLRKLVEWRGDDDGGKQVLEDVFREVIVISDDEESSEEEDDLTNNFRDVSVEIVSSTATRDYLNPDPIILEKPRSGYRESGLDSNSNRRPTDRHVAAYINKPRTRDHDKIDRRGFSRYKTWKEARDEYRANPADVPIANPQSSRSTAHQPLFRQSTSDLVMREPPQQPALESYEPQLQKGIPAYVPSGALESIRMANGNLKERRTYDIPDGSRQRAIGPSMYGSRISDTAKQKPSLQGEPGLYRRTKSTKSQDTNAGKIEVLPSLETARMPPASSPGHLGSDHYPSTHSTRGRPGLLASDTIPRRLDGVEFLDLSEDSSSLKKKRKVDDLEPNAPSMNHIDNMNQNHSSRPREPRYVSLVSPTHRHSQPSPFTPVSMSRHGAFFEREAVPSANFDQKVPVSVRLSDESARSLAHPRSRQDLARGHVSNRGPLSELDLSARICDELVPVGGLRSAPVVAMEATDCKIQEYRAFRAREKHDRVIQSASGRRGHPAHGTGDFVSMEALSFQPGSAKRLPRDMVSLPSSVLRNPTVEDAELYLSEDGSRFYPAHVDERDLRRRRSASPVSFERKGVEHVPAPPPSQVERHVGRSRYPIQALESVSSTRERQGPVFLRPTGRHEQSIYAAQPLLADVDDRRPRSANCRRYYAQL